jgi:hypothetical protein
MTKQIIKYSVAIAVILYLVFAFVISDINAVNWEMDARFMYIFLTLSFSVLTVILIMNNGLNSKQ